MDRAGLREHAAAQRGRAQALLERPVGARDRERGEVGRGVLVARHEAKEAREVARRELVALREPRAVDEGVAPARDPDLLEEGGLGLEPGLPRALAARDRAEDLEAELGVVVLAPLVDDRERLGEQRCVDR